MVKNILGQGIDIHLLGLRELARRSGVPEALAVFEDQSYMDINHFSLSTSQVIQVHPHKEETWENQMWRERDTIP